METIVEAKAHIIKHASDKGGCLCPVCGRKVETFIWALDGPICNALKLFYDVTCELNPIGGWLQVRRDVYQDKAYTGDYAKLAHWGLLEKRKGRSGYWRVTREGVSFVEGLTSAPAYAFTLFGECIGVSTHKTVLFEDIMKGAK